MSTKKQQAEVAVPGPTALSTEVHDYGEFAGGGRENMGAGDMAIPFINLLQSLSPEITGPEGKIEGATVGMMLNTVTKQLISGDEGFLFVPCAKQEYVMEWKPRKAGGGLVARHDPNDAKVIAMVEAARAAAAETDEPMAWKSPAGNDLVHTYYLFGFVIDELDSVEPREMVCVSFSITKIRHYKEAMTRMLTRKGNPPLYSNRLRITSFTDKNTKGVFANFHIEPAIENNTHASAIPPQLDGEVHPLLLAGRQFSQQVLAGQVKTDDEAGRGSSGGGKAGNEKADKVF